MQEGSLSEGKQHKFGAQDHLFLSLRVLSSRSSGYYCSGLRSGPKLAYFPYTHLIQLSNPH